MYVEQVLRDKGRQVTMMRDTDSVASAVKVLAAKRIGAVLVRDHEDNVAGIFSERDLVNALAGQDAAVLTLPVRDLMSTPVFTCKASDRIDAALAQMTRNRVRHLPVMDGGELLGIVSIGDLVQHRLVEKETETNVLLDIARMRG